MIDVVNPYHPQIKWWWRFEVKSLFKRFCWKVIISISLDLSTFATVITQFDQYVLLQFKNNTTILWKTSWRHRVRKLCIRPARKVPSAPFSKLLPESCSKKLRFLFHLIREKFLMNLSLWFDFVSLKKTRINPQAYFYSFGKSNQNASARLHIRSLLPSGRGFFAKLI